MKCVVCKTDQRIENVMLVTSKANGSTRAICRPEVFYDSKDAEGNLEVKGHRPRMNPCFRYAVAGATVASIRLAWPAEADGGATTYQAKSFPIRPGTPDWVDLMAEAGWTAEPPSNTTSED